MTIQPITPLRQRMIEDMTIRRLKERMQDFYQRAVTKYAQHFHRSPGELDYEHVRQYQLHLVQSGWNPGYLNRTMSALRFFYKVTLGRPDALEMIPLVPEPPRKLRQVLTPEEVVRLIEAAPANTVVLSASLTARGCVPRKLCRSRSPTSTASAWC